METDPVRVINHEKLRAWHFDIPGINHGVTTSRVIHVFGHASKLFSQTVGEAHCHQRKYSTSNNINCAAGNVTCHVDIAMQQNFHT